MADYPVTPLTPPLSEQEIIRRQKLQGLIDAGQNPYEITRLKAIIDNAVVVSESEINTDNVSVGTTVKYVNVATGKEAEYGIVGADEADPLKGLISNESPIGMALLGHKVGDTVEVEIPKGFLTLRIVDIHRSTGLPRRATRV